MLLCLATEGIASWPRKTTVAAGTLIVLGQKIKNGYKNPIKMVSLPWTEGFYGRPRIDKELLEKYHEDLIISGPACLGGEIPQHIMHGRIDKAEESIKRFKNLFGEDLLP